MAITEIPSSAIEKQEFVEREIPATIIESTRKRVEDAGLNPTDDEYINALYQNVLGRGASSDEVAYYQDHFDRGIWDRPQVMINFAESPENINLVSPQIENGIFLESFL